MRRYKLTLLATAAALGLAMQFAAAADLPRKAPVYAPPPPPPQDWSGIYVGLEGGYGWGHQNTDGTSPFRLNGLNGHNDCFGNECGSFDEFGEFLLRLNAFPDPNRIGVGSLKQRGWLAGGFFGAQKQWGSWVFGLEGDIDGANIKKSGTGLSSTVSGRVSNTDEFISKTNSVDSFESKIDMLGSLRGKIGFSPAPQWLIYGTGGLAFAHVKNALNGSQSYYYLDCDEGNCNANNGAVWGSFDGSQRFGESLFGGASGTSMFGWAAGAGVDWKLPVDAGSAWVFGVEYLHYGFGDHTITLAGPDGGSLSFNATQKVDTIKGRISYLFSIH